MAIDFKLNEDKGYWDIDFSNGDIASTNSLDTAIYMSIFCEKRASQSQVSEPSLRRGHFTNMFNKVSDYEVGSLFWLYTNQAKINQITLSLIENSALDGLKWLIEDKIFDKIEVNATKVNDTQITLTINLINNQKTDSLYYNLIINL